MRGVDVRLALMVLFVPSAMVALLAAGLFVSPGFGRDDADFADFLVVGGIVFGWVFGVALGFLLLLVGAALLASRLGLAMRPERAALAGAAAGTGVLLFVLPWQGALWLGAIPGGLAGLLTARWPVLKTFEEHEDHV